MKAIFVAMLAGLLLHPVAGAQEVGPATTPAPAPKAECPLCKVPNRAALMAGTARKCPVDCKKLCCTGTEVTYVVEGLVCDDCTSKVTAALARLEGVAVEAVCHNTGQARLRYDPAQVTPATLIATIISSGHPVTGEKVAFQIPALSEEARAAEVEGALRPLPGVLKIVTTVGATPSLVVLFNPSETTRAKIIKTIGATGIKIAE